MTLRWHALADAYVGRARVWWIDRLTQLHEQNEITEQRLEFCRRSPAALAVFLECALFRSGAGPEDIEQFRRMSQNDLAAFKQITADVVRMQFMRAIVHDAAFIPPELTFELVRGAVYTINPSCNRAWIEEVSRLEPGRTAVALLWFLRNGSAFEAGGAANASYWFHAFAPDWEVRYFRRHFLANCLKRFVESDDTDLRRCVVAMISWDVGNYEPALRPMLKRAAAIAANHPDDYIRQRYRVDTGQSGSYPYKPHRDLYSDLRKRGVVNGA